VIRLAQRVVCVASPLVISLVCDRVASVVAGEEWPSARLSIGSGDPTDGARSRGIAPCVNRALALWRRRDPMRKNLDLQVCRARIKGEKRESVSGDAGARCDPTGCRVFAWLWECTSVSDACVYVHGKADACKGVSGQWLHDPSCKTWPTPKGPAFFRRKSMRSPRGSMLKSQPGLPTPNHGLGVVSLSPWPKVAGLQCMGGSWNRACNEVPSRGPVIIAA
jgi:hypothetical protein